ncbi:hypothetical protein GB937_007905 [Aspergillus fischeri]|nr:hypothetical protein GB937_007905 [Aspergillus fischeri]
MSTSCPATSTSPNNTTEGLLASAFLMQRLEDYSIMHHTGRLDSFNTFMTGKFGRFRRTDFQQGTPYFVDAGGGRRELLIELKAAHPNSLGKDSLVLQEYNAEIRAIPDITVMTLNYKEDGSEQPVRVRLYTRWQMCCIICPTRRQSSEKWLGQWYHDRDLSYKSPRRMQAASSGLKVTFEAYPPVGMCLVETMVSE